MFATCTHQAAEAMGLHRLTAISRMFVHVALAAWLVTSWGLIRRLVRLMVSPGASSSSWDRSG